MNKPGAHLVSSQKPWPFVAEVLTEYPESGIEVIVIELVRCEAHDYAIVF